MTDSIGNSQSRHDFDRPLRRLVWIVPASVILWIAAFACFSLMLRNHVSLRTAGPLQVSLIQTGGACARESGRPGSNGGGSRFAATNSLLAPKPSNRPHHDFARKPAPRRRMRTAKNSDHIAAPRQAIPKPAAAEPARERASAKESIAEMQSSARPAANSSATASAENHAGGDGGREGGSGGGQAAGGSALYVDVDHPPVPISKVLPHYPSGARSQGVEGEVVLRAVVDQHGAVEDGIVVVRSIPMLDRAAIDALRQWRFEPGRDADNRAVRVVIEVPLRFRLR